MSSVQCYSCKGFGHMTIQCPRKMCNYCKKSGHVIKECPIRPPLHGAYSFSHRRNMYWRTWCRHRENEVSRERTRNREFEDNGKDKRRIRSQRHHESRKAHPTPCLSVSKLAL